MSTSASYKGLDIINELKLNPFSDFISPSQGHTEKINEVIQKVNILIEIENGRLNLLNLDINE